MQQFFNQQRFDVEDNGFSHRVMRMLPDRARRLNRLWTAVCTVVAAFFVAGRGWKAVSGSLQGAWADISNHDLMYQLSPLTIYMGLLFLAIAGSYRLVSKS